MIKSTSNSNMEGDGCDKAGAEQPLDYSLSCSMNEKTASSNNPVNDNIVDNGKNLLSGGDSYTPTNNVLEERKETVESTITIDANNANLNTTSGDDADDLLKATLKLRTPPKQEDKDGIIGQTVFANNNVIESNNNLKYSLLTNSYGDDSQNWKTYYDTEYERHVRFPWKRMAYVVVILVLGITCAILALMKIFGGAEWMNTATFAVIITGGIMLLPPGLYYGRILICICCRCKEYSLWDIPAGPFGG